MKRLRNHGRIATNMKVIVGAAVLFAALLAIGTAVASTSSSPTLPPNKKALLDQQSQRRDQAAARNSAKGITKANAPAAAPAPAGSQMPLDVQVAAGDGVIIQSSIAPAGDTATKVENRWLLKQGDSQFVVVFAGCDAAASSEGVILVSQGPGTPVARYTAPGAHGCLTIVGATHRTLQLVAADGFKSTFDVKNSTFG